MGGTGKRETGGERKEKTKKEGKGGRKGGWKEKRKKMCPPKHNTPVYIG